jgi:formate hydrogenlyase subunit 6/NADH:ubiquinone oxidoreductase subunit I
VAFTVPSAERRSIVAALEALARRHGGRVPASLFHRVGVHSACEGHRVCASACPTGALVRYRDDGSRRMGIAFDGAACIGCGHCAAVCPEQALELHHGGGSAQSGHRPLTRFLQRECADCGARFASTANDFETHCERCRKSAQLARSAFTTLFPARP